jgi:hypothetical protein
MQPGLLCRCWIPPHPLAFIVVWLILGGFIWGFLWAFLWCFLGFGLAVGIGLVVGVLEAFLWCFLGNGLVVAVIVWRCNQSRQLSDRHGIWQAASLAALALRKHRRNDWQKSWPDAEPGLAGDRSWRQHR